MLRNVSGQAIGSQVLNVDTGAAFAGAVTVYVTGDGGVQAIGVVGGGLCTNEGNGYFSYTPSQAETNYHLVAFTFVGTRAVPATVQVATITEAQAAAIASSTITTIIGDGPTRIELLHALAHRLNKTPPPNMDPATETRLASYLNQRQRRLLTLPGLKRLRDATVTFQSTPEVASYGLPSISKVDRIYEHDNERTLFEMSLQEYRLIQPRPIAGTPEAFIWTGRQVVAQQPSLPAALFVVSTNDSDKVVVYLEGALASGALRSIATTLQGLTPVNVAPLVSSWARVDKFYLAAPAQGAVSLVEGIPTGPTLAAIPIGSVSTTYVGLTLHPTPSAVTTYYVDVQRVVTDLVRATDEAALPVDFSDILVLGALADEYQHLSDPRWPTAMGEYKERERQLQYFLAETAIGRPFGLARSWERPSQLGSWFPAGS